MRLLYLPRLPVLAPLRPAEAPPSLKEQKKLNPQKNLQFQNLNPLPEAQPKNLAAKSRRKNRQGRTPPPVAAVYDRRTLLGAQRRKYPLCESLHGAKPTVTATEKIRAAARIDFWEGHRPRLTQISTTADPHQHGKPRSSLVVVDSSDRL